MNKIKSNLRAICKIPRILPDINTREIKQSDLMILKPKSAQMLENIDRGLDKLVTAKQSQIISYWRKRSVTEGHRILPEQVGSYFLKKASSKHE